MMQDTRNPHILAMFLGIPVATARTMIIEENSYLEGWGKPSMHQHIISRRELDEKWPRADKARLEYHRKLHDQGLMTMCQGRDGNFILQYAVPSQVKRNAYFSERNI
jgi:hypothetical protein